LARVCQIYQFVHSFHKTLVLQQTNRTKDISLGLCRHYIHLTQSETKSKQIQYKEKQTNYNILPHKNIKTGQIIFCHHKYIWYHYTYINPYCSWGTSILQLTTIDYSCFWSPCSSDRCSYEFALFVCLRTRNPWKFCANWYKKKLREILDFGTLFKFWTSLQVS